MKGDRDRDDSTYTYSDAMNDWASTQKKTFIRRTRGTLFHPSPDSYGIGRVLGYMWRFGALAIVLGLLWIVGLRTQVETQEFADRVAAATKSSTGAEDVSFERFSLKGSDITSAKFHIRGGAGSPYRTIDGHHLRLKDVFSGYFSKIWEIGDIEADHIVVNLRSGGLGSIPDLPIQPSESAVEEPSETPQEEDSAEPFRMRIDDAPPEDGSVSTGPATKHPVTTTASIMPGTGSRFESVTYGALSASQIELSWGLTERTSGALIGSGATLDSAENGDWLLTVDNGELHQNWWRTLEFKQPLAVRIGVGKVTFNEAEVFPKGGGRMTIAGSVSTGEIPELDIDLVLADVPIAHLVGSHPTILKSVEGTVSGTASLGGSINTSDGVISMLEATVTKGILRRIRVLETLALITGQGQLRSLPLDGATFSLKSSGGVIEITGFTLAGNRDCPISLSGSFTIDTEENFSGQLAVGFDAADLEEFPQIQETFFADRPATDGLPAGLWIDIPVGGQFQELGNALADRLLSAYQEAEGN